MNEIKSYKDLLIWKKGITIVKLVYQLVKTFPQEEIYALSSQLKRASVSIPSNIAEGYGRNGNKDYLKFLNIAIASLFEMQTQLEIAFNLKYINETQFKKTFEESREIERMLSSFYKKIKERT